jgi:hypothetical protein
METLTTQNSKFKLSTTNSYRTSTDRISKPGLVPQVNFFLPIDSNVFLKLIDNAGKIIQIIINGEFLRSGQYSNEITLNNLQPGDYYCVMETQESREVRTIRIKQNNL